MAVIESFQRAALAARNLSRENFVAQLLNGHAVV
jgi:hypothetical protein